MDIEIIFYAFLGGLLPAIFWLWFWLREDSAHPEPHVLTLITFLAGIIAVLFVIPLSQFAYNFLNANTILLFIALAVIEETVKFIAAYVAALRNKAVDEPIDPIIYMITVALGFTALENALFLFEPFTTGNILSGLADGNLRFIGASLLHVLTSAVVGLSMSLTFYRSKKIRRYAVILGILIASVLHTMFNLSIISDSGSNTFPTFFILWFSVVGLLLAFEKIKRLNKNIL